MKKATLISALMLMLVLATPGTAFALGDQNDIDQDVESHASADEIITNQADFDAYGWDVAIASANCQRMILADAWVIVVSAAEGLGMITDEDEFSSSGVRGSQQSDFERLSAEDASADCTQPTGDVNIQVQVAKGFAEPAPQGSVADVMDAVRFSLDFGDDNRINQHVSADASANDVIENDWEMYSGVSNGAVAGTTCQSLIGGHIGAIVASLSRGSAEIEDSDTIEFEVPNGPSTSSAVIEERLVVENDHTATSSCSQDVGSVTVHIGHDGVSGLPTES